ncbi:MAG: hypothetical protein E6I51_09035 [Chloroflexi bacterium]|nr:MAG: hypothetical protein E6I51_09035 [Chloroflexota bacterium]
MRLVKDEHGQTIVVAALLLTLLIALVGLGVDVSWFSFNLVRMQRAADAAALAGVVYLPGDPTGANTAALAEATKNGYTNGVGGVSVTPVQDSLNNRALAVTIRAPVQSYFAKIVGVATFPGERNSRAEFVLPLPMGSPQDYYGVATLCRNTDPYNACPAVPSATGIGTDASQGFWGAVIAKGGDRSNGDAYSTYYNPAPTLNTQYDANGYSYIVEFPAGTLGGAVWIFDPIFCPTGRRTSTPFQHQGTPYSTADDVLMATDGGLFANMDYVDKSVDYGGDHNYGAFYTGLSSPDCATNPYHNHWWQLASGLGEGSYRLQVTTSQGATAQSGLNNFGIQVTTMSGSAARVYGQSRMCAYVNIANTTALFYLAQVDAVYAGKTLEIRLFDPGDVTNTTLRIEQPTATGYVDASFRFTATGSSGGAPTSGGPQTSLATSNAFTTYYNNQWVTITVPLPTSYDAPTPPGETQPGWWKIQYNVGTSGQDVTTWEVNIRGNPVHLVIP